MSEIKTILLTGAFGMLGRNFQEHSKAKNYIIKTPHSTQCNLLKYDSIVDWLEGTKPDVVIHMAARVGGIQANINNQYTFMTENLEMGMNLIKAAKQCKIKKIINIGSSCMYPRDFTQPLKEEYLGKGEFEPTNFGYGLAKFTVAKMLEQAISFDKDFNLTFEGKTFIVTNMYGAFDKFNDNGAHLIPAIIYKVHKAKQEKNNTIEMWGKGKVRREFIYVEDVADFIFFALENWNKIPQTINVGLGYDFSIKEYYEEVIKVIGLPKDFKIISLTDKPEGMVQKLLDVSQIHKLGWYPKHTVEQGLKKTYEWYVKNSSK